MNMYDVNDWYWVKEDGSLFSSKRQIEVDNKDGEFLEWAEDGSVPTGFPVDENGNESYLELLRVLKNDYTLKASITDLLSLVKHFKSSEINAECSAVIASGFWFKVSDVNLHFSYDSFDQQNFADTANACMAAVMSGMFDETVVWNGYVDAEHAELIRVTFKAQDFLTFYNIGALRSHKGALMEKAGLLKELVKEAKTVEEVGAITWTD